MDEIDLHDMQEAAGIGQEIQAIVTEWLGMPETATEAEIDHRVYKNTDCGAWFKFTETGIQIGSIVEGSEATFDFKLDYPFTQEDIERNVEDLEGYCAEAWKEANEEEGDHECDNCGEIYNEDELDEIEDYHQRVDAGGLVPSGECPADDCGALCYPRDALAKFRERHPQVAPAAEQQTLVDETGDGRDYELIKSAQSVWVIVDGVSIWIRRGEEKELVMVEAYRKGDEDGEPMWTKETWVKPPGK